VTAVGPKTSNGRLATEAGAIVGLALLNVGTAVGYAALIFTGPLAIGLPRAASAFLLGSAVVTIVMGIRGRINLAFSKSQDGPVIVMAAVAVSMVAKDPGTGPVSVIVMIGLTTALTGIGMIVVGRFGFGRIVRYLPTTVVSAFIAGTGWLLFKGGFDVMVSQDLGLGDVADLFGASQLKFWAPGLLLGTITLAVGLFPKVPPIAGSIVTVVGIGAFFAVGLGVSSLSDLQNDGWFIGPFPDGVDLKLISATEVADMSWALVSSQIPGLLTVIAVSLVAVLLNLTSFEAIDRTSVDVDHEVTSAGVANLLAAPLGGIVGFHAIGNTVLARQLGMSTRAVPIGAGILVGLMAAFGGEAIGYMPRMVAGGVLVAVGLGLLFRWVEELFATVDWLRRLLGIGVVLVIASVGILEGVAAGTIAAIVLFVIQYSHIDPVRNETDGVQSRSHVDRSPAEEARLEESGGGTSVVQLQGFLFFGSLGQLADRIRRRLSQHDPELGVVVLDFKHVTGIDWSGYSLLSQLGEQVEASGAVMLISGLSPQIATALRRSEPAFAEQVGIYSTLDAAMEAAEQRLLSAWSETIPAEVPVQARLSADLLAHFDASTVEPESVVMRQGVASDEFHIVVSGSLLAYRVDPDGSRQRLRRFGVGTFIGEIGMVTGNVRSAEVVADTEVHLLTMRRATFARLRTENPDLALELQDRMLIEQSDRVVSLSRNLARALR